MIRKAKYMTHKNAPVIRMLIELVSVLFLKKMYLHDSIPRGFMEIQDVIFLDDAYGFAWIVWQLPLLYSFYEGGYSLYCRLTSFRMRYGCRSRYVIRCILCFAVFMIGFSGLFSVMQLVYFRTENVLSVSLVTLNWILETLCMNLLLVIFALCVRKFIYALIEMTILAGLLSTYADHLLLLPYAGVFTGKGVSLTSGIIGLFCILVLYRLYCRLDLKGDYS